MSAAEPQTVQAAAGPCLVVATRNPGKAAEFIDLLAGVGVKLQTLRDFPEAPEVAEQATSYLDNARAKALVIARHAGHAALGDDSGLEVDALAGRPGVLSARFAGKPTDDRRNVELLLEMLQEVPPPARTARFRCVLVVARPDGVTLSAEGSCEGTIAWNPAGAGGFGYDPVFLVPELGRTFAELPAAEKQRLSHRARACAVLRPQLKRFVAAYCR